METITLETHVKTSTHHMCQSVPGAIRNWPKSTWEAVAKDNNTTVDAVKERMRIYEFEGRQVIPIKQRCSGFSDIDGCPGHEQLPIETVISDCGQFRYQYHFRIEDSPVKKYLIAALCNPSTANHVDTDRTVEKFIEIAKHHGCTDLIIINMSPFRSKDVADVEAWLSSADPELVDKVMQLNDKYIDSVMNISGEKIIICGWGSYDKITALRTYAERFLKTYAEYDLGYLKQNADGSYRHPLYTKATTPIQRIK